MWQLILRLLGLIKDPVEPPTSLAIERTEVPMSRTINQAGLDLLKQYEGLKLEAYPDPGTGGDPWTCGFGSTGPDIKKGLVWTVEQAENRLKEDLAKFEKGVEELAKVPITDNQFSALVVFSYNVGLGNLSSSTLLKLLNAGNPKEEVANWLLRWNKANGNVMPGLVKRREAEKELFLKP